ncbi:hypothetical protein FRB94_006907 [Tulasnella sp. JGI-2019a]|nr:hypothetical protein FRB94_006907 [Tulasnella sp. JGI-2019a]
MKYASRKYIDLIQKIDGKWANWNPTIPHPEVGDYGIIDKETGAFEKDGSIYDASFAKFFPNLNLYPPRQATEDQDIIINSRDARRYDLTSNCRHSWSLYQREKWSFPNERGALLVMVKSRSSFLPPNILLKQLAKTSVLTGKYLVTEVIKTPSYFMYLSDKGGDEISLALSANIPVVQVLGLSAGGELSGGWLSENAKGVLKRGTSPGGAYGYTPLFTLKKIRRWLPVFRQGAPSPDREDDEQWEDVDAPWENLDEDGCEDSIDTEVADDW